MPDYTQEFNAEEGVLHVRVAGTLPKALLQAEGNVFQPLIDACAEHNCRQAVIDALDLQVDLDTMSLFRAGVDAALVSRLGLRLAFVAREDMLDSFFEVVVSNRGARVEIFTEMKDAMIWVSGS
jgi:hypothetical protein